MELAVSQFPADPNQGPVQLQMQTARSPDLFLRLPRVFHRLSMGARGFDMIHWFHIAGFPGVSSGQFPFGLTPKNKTHTPHTPQSEWGFLVLFPVGSP